MTITEMKTPELKGEQIGLTTSETLQHYLKRYLDRADWSNVSQKTNIGFHTVRNLVYGTSSITKDNYIALVELTRMAIIKCEDESQDARAAMRKLKSILKNVE